MADRKTGKKAAEKSVGNGATDTSSSSNGSKQSSQSYSMDEGLSVQKTYKLYIGGAFPRTESGRYFPLKDKKGKLFANFCLASRKDFRNAVVAARAAQGKWASRSAYNRGQIIYRIAEMLEWRKVQFIDELVSMGSSASAAKKEVSTSIDRIVHYAGWADKYQQIFSAVNPVASSHFNFSVPEPMGVVSAFAPEESGLIGLISCILPVITGGNSVVALASSSLPACAISFAEVLHTSDLPGGVVNILTGNRSELISHFSSHKDVNAMWYAGQNEQEIRTIEENATENVKRIRVYNKIDWLSDKGQSPYFISDLSEIKTTWHPVG